MRWNGFLPARSAGRDDRKRGLARRALRRLGPTWAASPIRRLVQSGFFVLFFVMLFWVLRPRDLVAAGPGAPAHEPKGTELFLAVDPLVSLSTAVASRAWVWSLPYAAVILGICVLLPRAFCGYFCPLGTLIDLSDWAVNKRVTRCRLAGRGWWVHLKYYILAGVFVAALAGVLLSGFFAAIPVLTRGMVFVLGPVQVGAVRGWHVVAALHAGHYISIGLFLLVLGLGLLGPRFWCRCVCPTGAIFSVVNRLRLTQRKVEASCVRCGRCGAICPFDAIHDDFATRTADCAFCQTCGGVCPVGAIQFAPRWDRANRQPAGPEPARDVPLSRRGFLIGAAASGAVAMGTRTVLGARLGAPNGYLPVRPPGAVPEREFLRMCVRCQECVKACPTGLLQPVRFEQGLEGLWTPRAETDWAGCDPNCNRCGAACPTGAVRALPLAEKQAARMGLAVVDERTCLPHAGREACQLCVDACAKAGYKAIEFIRVHAETDEDGVPIEGSGFLAPVVLADRCVGCGLCQARCWHINVRGKGRLAEAAIRVEVGPGREDRLRGGSYVALREVERRRKQTFPAVTRPVPGGDDYLPDFLK